MKKLLVILSVLILIVIGAAAAIPMFVSVDKIKTIAQQQVKEKIGRDLNINGNISFSIFPVVSITINDVSFSNPDWSKNKNMISDADLSIGLETMPLFKKEINVKHVTLTNPKINLEKSKDGKVNWDIKIATTDNSKKEEESKSNKQDNQSNKAKINSLTLGDITINNASLNYVDNAANVKESLDKVNLNVSAKDLNSSAKISGDVVYKLEKINFDTEVSSIQDILDGKSVDNKLNISSSKFDVNFNGKLSSNESEYLKGNFDVNVASISAISKWLGRSVEIPFEKLSFKTNANVTSSKLKLENMDLSLDEVKGSGVSTINYKGAKPSIYADLKVNKIKMDRFLAGAEAKSNNSGNAASNKKSNSSQKIDLSGLKAVDLDLKLQTSGLEVMGANFGANKLTTTLKGGKLALSISETSLFDGKIKLAINVNANPSKPYISTDFTMNDVKAEPLLKTFVDFDKLSGTTDAKLNFKTSGVTQSEFIKNLSGNGSFTFADGEIKGINLVDILNNIRNNLTEFGLMGGSTKFVKLGGTFTANNGVFKNDDLKLFGPLVEATGNGYVDLTKNFVNYTVIPFLTASKQDAEVRRGIKIPVKIKGEFSNIKVKPDYKAVLNNALKNPEDIKAMGKDLEKAGKELLENKDQLKEVGKELLKDPDSLKNLLQGFGR